MNALEMLANTGSWKLERISPTTSPGDVAMRLRSDMSKQEIQGMMALLKMRTAYRCRIGKGRWYFGSTPEQAAKSALAGMKQCN